VNNAKKSEKKKKKSGTTMITANMFAESEAKGVEETAGRSARMTARSNKAMAKAPRLMSQVRGARRAIVLL
jgi:hypothetical protein